MTDESNRERKIELLIIAFAMLMATWFGFRAGRLTAKWENPSLDDKNVLVWTPDTEWSTKLMWSVDDQELLLWSLGHDCWLRLAVEPGERTECK